jgi:quercetin dioxygenase-like cupin family protein
VLHFTAAGNADCRRVMMNRSLPNDPGLRCPVDMALNPPTQRSLWMTFEFLHSTHQETPVVIPQIGLELLVRVPPQATGGILTSIETTNAPGFGPPLHRHRETEVFYVLEGCYLFQIDDKRITAGIGDVVVAPGGAAHAFVNITDKPARQFIQILPGLDAMAFFLGLGEVMRDGTLDRNALNAFGKLWQVEFLGPPLKVGRT